MKAPHRTPRHYYRRRSDLSSMLAALGIAGIILAVALLSCWGELARIVVR